MTDPSSPRPADSPEPSAPPDTAAPEPPASPEAAASETAASERPQPEGSPASTQRPEHSTRSSAARRRIAEVFGEVLPETTSDERDAQRSPTMSEDWYQENRPPHHDR